MSKPVKTENGVEWFADGIRIPASIRGVMVSFINDLAHNAYLQGAKDFLGKQESKQETKQEIKQETNAEGEEMMTVSRTDVQFYYQYYKTKSKAELSAEQKAYYKGRAKVLLDLFGSKCLPDELTEDNFAKSEPKYHIGQKVVYKKKGTVKTITGIDSVSDETGTSYYYNTVDAHGISELQFQENELDPYEESKPAEPKFGEADKVIYNGAVHRIVVGYGDGRYLLNKEKGAVHESDLEPYAEPKEDYPKYINTETGRVETFITDKNPKESDETFAFDSERRLNIATQICTALIGNQDLADRIISADEDLRSFANDAYIIADALIAEAEKKGESK